MAAAITTVGGVLTGISVLAPNSPTLYTPLGTPAHEYFLWPAKQHLAALRMLFDWLVVGHVIEVNPAHAVRGPKHAPIFPQVCRQAGRSADDENVQPSPATGAKRKHPRLQLESWGAFVAQPSPENCSIPTQALSQTS
jgi:hypothetical protein